jgi:hypothetical protein
VSVVRPAAASPAGLQSRCGIAVEVAGDAGSGVRRRLSGRGSITKVVAVIPLPRRFTFGGSRRRWQLASLSSSLDAGGGLEANDPDTILATLAEAFEDNEAAAAPLEVSGDEVSLVVLVPAEDAVPQTKPATTSAGNLTLKRLTKPEAAEWYRALVCGYVPATVKEAFAVAPRLLASM